MNEIQEQFKKCGLSIIVEHIRPVMKEKNIKTTKIPYDDNTEILLTIK